ncbi:hypothetical protein [Streptomyces sp. NPDC056244]|uniref:hypothetical protein n=1 Tax=Streptomyces sp. NPDC056244 TaxID=3345762 RepID=UPI0035E17D6F
MRGAKLENSIAMAAGVPPIHFGVHEIRTGSADGARADFEKMLAQLASATDPNVRMIAANPGDWGIDAFAGDLGGAITVWQSKYFMPITTTNQSQQIRESLANGLKAAAANGHTIERWILCIPSSMDAPAAHWWDGWRKRQEKAHGIVIELWDETKLVKRLQSPEGDQVRRAYYEPFTAPAAATNVSEGFRRSGPVPSGMTVTFLPPASGLSEEELPGLQRKVVGPHAMPSGAENQSGPGTLIGQWTPYDLEVHPAGPTMSSPRSGPQRRMLSGYVRREHDEIIAEAVEAAAEGQSRMVMLVGSSSTGKTRACWEAIQPLAKAGWRLWHPFDPTRADAALADLQQVRPRTVVWLNEAQHYLGDARVGEQIAAAVHALLTDTGRRPALVLGTLWPEYARQYTALPAPGSADQHSRVRELLAGRTLTVPETFNAPALAAAAQLAVNGDQLLAGPSPGPPTADGSHRTSPAPPNSCAPMSTAAQPPGPCLKPRWTPAASVLASICPSPSLPKRHSTTSMTVTSRASETTGRKSRLPNSPALFMGNRQPCAVHRTVLCATRRQQGCSTPVRRFLCTGSQTI